MLGGCRLKRGRGPGRGAWKLLLSCLVSSLDSAVRCIRCLISRHRRTGQQPTDFPPNLRPERKKGRESTALRGKKENESSLPHVTHLRKNRESLVLVIPLAMGSTANALRVLVAGGGIGGLTAAVALRQQGHDVEVSKSNPMISSV